MVTSAPSSRASANRVASAAVPVTMISPTPASRSATTQPSPCCPGPCTTTTSPSRGRATCCAQRMPLASGTNSAARSGRTPSGTRCMAVLGCRYMYCAYPPHRPGARVVGMVRPYTWRLAQLPAAAAQLWQLPQRSTSSTTTRSPSATPQLRRAREPARAIRPTISCPGMIGNTAPAMPSLPSNCAQSEPQIPTASTASRPSSSPVSGNGNSCSSTRRGAVKTAASAERAVILFLPRSDSGV